jgi:hypothetical protein
VVRREGQLSEECLVESVDVGLQCDAQLLCALVDHRKKEKDHGKPVRIA